MNIHCPACQGEIEITADLLGEGIACPHCEQPFLVTEDGHVAEYEAGGGGSSKKTAIIAICVAVLAVGGFVALLMSGEDPTEQAMNTPEPGAAQPADSSTPEPDGGERGMDQNVADFLTGSSPMDTSSGGLMEPMPPVEIPDTAEGAVNAVIQAMAEGNPRGYWDAMPASYQNEVNSIVRESADVVDPMMWDKGFQLTTRVTAVLRNKKDFIFAVPQLATISEKDEVLANYDRILNVLDTVLSSDISSRERLKQFDGGKFLGTTGAGLMANFAALSSLSPNDEWTTMMTELRVAQAKKIGESDGVVTVEFSSQTTNQVTKFVKVENRWVPEDMAKGWEQGVAEVRKQMEKSKAEKEQVSMGAMMIMGMLESALVNFENASTQEDFNAAVAQVMQMGAGMAGMGGPGGAGMQGESGMQGSGQFPPPGNRPPPGMQGNGQFPPPNMQGGGQFPPPGQGQGKGRPPAGKGKGGKGRPQ